MGLLIEGGTSRVLRDFLKPVLHQPWLASLALVQPFRGGYANQSGLRAIAVALQRVLAASALIATTKLQQAKQLPFDTRCDSGVGGGGKARPFLSRNIKQARRKHIKHTCQDSNGCRHWGGPSSSPPCSEPLDRAKARVSSGKGVDAGGGCP